MINLHKVDQTVKDLDKSSQWVTTVRKTVHMEHGLSGWVYM